MCAFALRSQLWPLPCVSITLFTFLRTYNYHHVSAQILPEEQPGDGAAGAGRAGGRPAARGQRPLPPAERSGGGRPGDWHAERAVLGDCGDAVGWESIGYEDID